MTKDAQMESPRAPNSLASYIAPTLQELAQHSPTDGSGASGDSGVVTSNNAGVNTNSLLMKKSPVRHPQPVGIIVTVVGLSAALIWQPSHTPLSRCYYYLSNLSGIARPIYYFMNWLRNYSIKWLGICFTFTLFLLHTCLIYIFYMHT